MNGKKHLWRGRRSHGREQDFAFYTVWFYKHPVERQNKTLVPSKSRVFTGKPAF